MLDGTLCRRRRGNCRLRRGLRAVCGDIDAVNSGVRTVDSRLAFRCELIRAACRLLGLDLVILGTRIN